MSRVKLRYKKALLAVPFSLLWLFILSFGIAVALIPQLFVSAYGGEPRYIERWIDAMDEIFNEFKEF
jgi:hypothetical protein